MFGDSVRLGFILAVLAGALICSSRCHALTGWAMQEQFGVHEPPVSENGVCAGHIGALPSFEATPPSVGTHLVRVSLPFVPAALPAEMGLCASCGGADVIADVRPLTYHPGRPRSIRRALVTFPFNFADTTKCAFKLALTPPQEGTHGGDVTEEDNGLGISLGPLTIHVGPDTVTWRMKAGETWQASLIAPPRSSSEFVAETVEAGQHYVWVRLLLSDPDWPRIIEVQADCLGTVAIQGHVQRRAEGDATAPDLGWHLNAPGLPAGIQHVFADGEPCVVTASDGATVVTFPVAPLTRRGSVASTADELRYLRCTADEGVPFQSMAWRRAAVVVGPASSTARNALLEPDLAVTVVPEAFDAVYGSGTSVDLALWPVLDDCSEYTRAAVKRSAAVGDDYGNITTFSHGQQHGGAYGMNRLNHCPAVFEEAYRTRDRALRNAAVLWCGNVHDLSLWWGDDDDFGGTRYNNASAAGHKEHEGDPNFMWRLDGASTFCTKGYDAFFYAYEETGDPRMMTALLGQVDYASKHVHADTGQCRDIGDVADFMRLYRFTGDVRFKHEALRLFRELRTKLSAGDLFSQGGQPIAKDGPFIDDDQHGYEAPFAKPYIIGYALAGLPDLLRECPDEPRLRDVVRAVADFLAASQDPTGGWRYPHPASSGLILSQNMEHAAQLVRAASVLEARGEPIDNLIDAIERALQTRVAGFGRSGRILASVTGWEQTTGAIPEGKTIYDLCAKPDDRDPSRDYTEGAVGVGSAPPEGLVYFPDVLRFYLGRRPAERLFAMSPELALVVARIPDARLRLTPADKGSYLRIERPDDPSVGFLLWGPEWVTFPELGYSEEELGGMALDWKRDEATGAVSYTIDRESATFTASFVPHPDYVECTYTTWPKPGVVPSGNLGVGPCTQMKAGVFETDSQDLLSRLWFLSNGEWTSLGSCAGGNERNVLHIQGNPSPEMTGGMAESGWRTIQSPRPDNALIACTSPDGRWVAATAAEFSTSLCNNAGASHRCIHSQGSIPLRKDGPTTLRVHVYLLEGTLDDLRARYELDAARWQAAPAAPPAAVAGVDTYGVRRMLPSFNDIRVRRMGFPLAWPHTDLPFAEWRAEARRVYLDSLSTPPQRATFAPAVIAVEDRGAYEARKIAFNVNADCRIKAYLLVPKGNGPFPGMIALHDHGAHFSIGKEKVVRPFGEPQAVLDDATAWVNECYGGRWIGDELAKRGYVVLAIDVLYWGDRGRMEGVDYEDQQAVGANMLHLGYSWAGYNVWDDIRSAEFLQGLPEVDPDRIACVGLSMGANRTWHLAAATDIVKAGAAICWMGDTATLAEEGNNQTTGYSAYSMIHPGLRNALDYPDVAAIACPKPMLFFNGSQDGLFPVPGVEAAYARMRDVWESQDVAGRLYCRLWDVPHEFNAAMQEDAFAWLDRYMK